LLSHHLEPAKVQVKQTMPKTTKESQPMIWSQATSLSKILHSSKSSKSQGAAAAGPLPSCTLGSGDVEGHILHECLCTKEEGSATSPSFHWELLDVSQEDKLAIFAEGKPENLDLPENADAVGGLVHWAVYDIPSSVAMFPRGVAQKSLTFSIPDGSGGSEDATVRQAVTSFGQTSYSAMCPPAGYTSKYNFRMVVYPGHLEFNESTTDLSWQNVALQIKEAGVLAECQFGSQSTGSKHEYIAPAKKQLPGHTAHSANKVRTQQEHTKPAPRQMPIPRSPSQMHLDLEQGAVPAMMEGQAEEVHIDREMGAEMTEDVITSDSSTMKGMMTTEKYAE